MPSLPGRLQGAGARSIYRSRPVPPGNGGIFPAAGAAGPEPGASVPPSLSLRGGRGGHPAVPCRRDDYGGAQRGLPPGVLPLLPGGPPVGRRPAPPFDCHRPQPPGASTDAGRHRRPLRHREIHPGRPAVPDLRVSPVPYRRLFPPTGAQNAGAPGSAGRERRL